MSKVGSIGIDFGTTKTSLAYAQPNGGKPDILTSFPTVVFFPDESNRVIPKPIIGDNALSDGPTKVWKLFKLEMGNSKVSTQCRDETYNDTFDRPSPQHLAALIFRELKQLVTRETGLSTTENIDSVTISVPAESNFRQRQAVIYSAVIAGFQNVNIVEEPISAFLMHYYARPSLFSNKLFSLVLDLGGGTCDLAVIKHQKGQIPLVLGTRTVRYGGNDIDEEIISFWKRNGFLKGLPETGNGQYDERITQELRGIARKAKHSCNPIPVTQSDLRAMLSAPLKTQVEASLPKDVYSYTHNGVVIPTPPLTPNNFAIILSDILSQIQNELDILLPSPGDKQKIDNVILAGGSSYIRQIIQFVREKFPHLTYDPLEIENNILFKEPEKAIAFGALEFQRNLSEGKEVIHPVLPMSTYLELNDNGSAGLTRSRIKSANIFQDVKVFSHNGKSYIELARRGMELKEDASLVRLLRKLIPGEKTPLLNPLAGAKLIYIPLNEGQTEIHWRIFQVRHLSKNLSDDKDEDYKSITEKTEPIDEIIIPLKSFASFIANMNAISFIYAFDIYGDFYRRTRLFTGIQSDTTSQHEKYPDFDWKNGRLKEIRDNYFGFADKY